MFFTNSAATAKRNRHKSRTTRAGITVFSIATPFPVHLLPKAQNLENDHDYYDNPDDVKNAVSHNRKVYRISLPGWMDEGPSEDLPGRWRSTHQTFLGFEAAMFLRKFPNEFLVMYHSLVRRWKRKRAIRNLN